MDNELEVRQNDLPVGVINADLPLDVIIERAEKMVAAQDNIRKMVLKVTSVSDWMDQNGKPYLQWTGASKVARTFGVSYPIKDIEVKTETVSDELGKFIRCRVLGVITWNGQQIIEMGGATSRDDLYGVRWRDVPDENNQNMAKKEKYFLNLSEIDGLDIEKKALTNFLNRAIKSLFGLNFTWNEIAQITGNRISLETVKAIGNGVSYRTGSRGGSETSGVDKQKLGEIEQMLKFVCDGEDGAMKAKLKELTKYGTSEGKTDVQKLSGAQIGFVHSKLKKIYDDLKDFKQPSAPPEA